jgi:hypothetical protein
MSKQHSIVKYLLEQRYQQNILNEGLDDGGEGGFSYNKLRKAKSPRREDLRDIAIDVAYKKFPGVEGMAQAEVPYAKENPVAYDKARSIFAKALVDARKEAFDERQKLIATGQPDSGTIDEKEVLKKALAKKPELAQILTRDEYESLAGDIINPLELNVSGKDEKTGNEYSKRPVTMDKWGGIDDNHAALYGFLRGAQDSLTTPEGLAMAAAGGALFKGFGMGAGALGRVVGPKVANLMPNFLKNAGKYAPAAIGGRARNAAEGGAAIAQSAVNLAGLGALGYQAYQADQAGQLPRFAGQVVGGVGPFAIGGKIAEKGIPAAIKAAPIAYAKGQEVAGDIGVVAKGTADSAVQAGKNVAGAVSAAGRAIADTSLSDIPGNIRTGIKELIPDPRYQIKKGPYQKNRNFEIDNLEPVDPTIPERRSIYDTSGQSEQPIYSNIDSNGNLVVDPQSPLYQTTPSNTTVTSKPTSSAKQRAAVTAMAALAARNGVPATNVDISKPSSSISSVETAPRENLGNVEMRPPTVPESKPVSAVDTTSSSSNRIVTSGSRSSTSIPGSVSTNLNVSAKPLVATSDTNKQTVNKYSNEWWKNLQRTKVSEKETVPSKANQTQKADFSVNKIIGGTLLPPENVVTVPSTQTPPPPPPPPIIPPLVPPIGTGSMGSGGGRGSYDDDEWKRMKGGDINAMIQNLYQTARTIRLR